jgi:hypothetical protein
MADGVRGDMGMDHEIDEFFEKVGTNASNPASRKVSEGIPTPTSQAERPSTPGKIVQYSHFETGYLPSTSTIPKLPAGCYRIHVSNLGVWFDPVKLVTDSLVQFPDTKSDSVIAEIEKFWQLKSKFREFGFSHKRGFLLWGPPGSGKTCTVAITIQKMVNKGGLVILADAPHPLSDGLAKIRSVEPEREMVVIWEDLDTVIERFGESEVLSILDGESQTDTVVFIATTNYPERLDVRITNRPSRFDRIEKIDMPTDLARKMYLESKVGTTISPDGTDLIEETKGMSIAHLRELIVGVWCQGNATAEVLSRLKKMKVRPNSAASNPIGIGAKNGQ